MDEDELKRKMAELYSKEQYGPHWDDPACLAEGITFANKAVALITPELEKAEEVDKFIGSCSLNPLHGCYRTCAECFFRMSCAKIKSKAEAKA